MVKVLRREEPVWLSESGGIADPLSDVTRRERRLLLGVTLLQVAVVFGGLLPTRISALGIELTSSEVGWLVWLICVVQAYLAVAFWYYVRSDLTVWSMRKDQQVDVTTRSFVERHTDIKADDHDNPDDHAYWLYTLRNTLNDSVRAELTMHLAVVHDRAWLELWPPLIFAGIAFVGSCVSIWYRFLNT